MLKSGQCKVVRGSHDTTTSTAVAATKPLKRINSRDLFEQMTEVEIDHEGRIYRLRLTQFNKLILTA